MITIHFIYFIIDVTIIKPTPKSLNAATSEIVEIKTTRTSNFNDVFARIVINLIATKKHLKK